MNIEQKKIFEEIAEEDKIQQKLIFIDGPGGTGKSYLLNGIFIWYVVIRNLSVIWLLRELQQQN